MTRARHHGAALYLALTLVGCERDGRMLERKNEDVEAGITHLAAGRHAEARQAFDRAARAHPSAPAVALDRGLAALAAGDHTRAREALLQATGDDAEVDVRAAAAYALGLSHHRFGEQRAEADDHPGAQTAFRDAAEAYRRALRTRPGQVPPAYNLEIVLRRLREEEEAERQQEQQEQQDQQGQDQQDPQQGQQDPQQGQQDPQQGQQDPQQGQQDPQQGQQDPQQGQQNQPPQPPQPSGDDRPREPPQPREAAPAEPGDGAQGLRPEQRALLDALERSEGSLEQERAEQRARVERRRPRQDW